MMTGRRPYYVAATAKYVRPATYMPGPAPRHRGESGWGRAARVALVGLALVAAVWAVVAVLTMDTAPYPTDPGIATPGRLVSTMPYQTNSRG